MGGVGAAGAWEGGRRREGGPLRNETSGAGMDWRGDKGGPKATATSNPGRPRQPPCPNSQAGQVWRAHTLVPHSRENPVAFGGDLWLPEPASVHSHGHSKWLPQLPSVLGSFLFPPGTGRKQQRGWVRLYPSCKGRLLQSSRKFACSLHCVNWIRPVDK